ncbi:DUF3889 domain-containing protein [Salirhabdus sp. Marseille-P4669]|uniref:DUF3889 domain-containing protein n=1 Tax=Salirhabdus sp. Marseille-P4669 TaxID=2042310 RepID=UPI000C7DDB34|nr:DUF3889 domain-containing protein [Salirhabdus sp. Marseille-P4669]
MKKKLVLLFCIFAFGLLPYAYSAEQVAAYENKAPDYVKWGKIAVKETSTKYPQSNIVDYLHLGREKNKTYSVEKFKFILNNDGKDFAVFVNVTFHNETEKVKDITFQEKRGS